MLTFFKEIVRLRLENPALKRGDITLLPAHGDVLAFWRESSEQRCLVGLNLSEDPKILPIGRASLGTVYSTGIEPFSTKNGTLHLGPYQIYVGEYKG
jgi:hypothetical protein